MRFLILLTLLAPLLTLQTSAVSAETEAGCPVFVLRPETTGFHLERSEIAPGETRVFPGHRGSGVLAIILPPATGTSGSLIQQDEEVIHVVRCGEGTIRYELPNYGFLDHVFLESKFTGATG